jgi:hypothetical protein
MTRDAPWLLVIALALVYAVVTLATGGSPPFPTRDDCVRDATADGEVDAVFGYFESDVEAVRARDRALEVGFTGTEAARNGCGRVRVAVGPFPSREIGQDFAEQARGVGLEVTLEQSP